MVKEMLFMLLLSHEVFVSHLEHVLEHDLTQLEFLCFQVFPKRLRHAPC